MPPFDSDKSLRWGLVIQVLIGLGLTALFFYMMAPFVIAILLGAVLAILLHPLYDLTRKGMSPNPSALVSVIVLTMGVLIPVAFLFYSATYKLLMLVNQLRLLKDSQSIETLAENPTVRQILAFATKTLPVDREFVKGHALDLLALFIERTSGMVVGFLASAPGLFVAGFVVILSTFFFLTDGPKFLRFLQTLSPLGAGRAEELYTTFERTCRGVVLGLFLSAVAQGIIMGILFLVTGLSDPLFIALLTVIAGMIPLVGAAPLWMGATIYLLAQNHFAPAMVMLGGGVAVSLVDNLVRPWVMKDHAEMHPFLALVSVFGAISLLGPTGIFLGPIIAAVFVSFLKIVSLEMRRENMVGL